MQIVSQKWLDTHNKTITDEGFVEVILTLTDPDVLADTTFDDNGGIYVSNVEQITSEVDKAISPYATLEQNLWVLDGNREILPEGNNVFPDNANMTNCTRQGDIFTRSATVYDSILRLSDWVPQAGKTYTIVVEILDDVITSANYLTLLSDSRFAFDDKKVYLKYGMNYITVRARDNITNDMLGSVWLNSMTILPSVRFKMSIIEHSDYGEYGFVSEATSGADGGFSTYPTVKMNFSKTHINLIQGVTITWSTTYDEYPVDFVVTAYNGDTPITTKEVTGNAESKTVVYLDMVNYDSITISVKKWCLPYHRARVEEVLVGVEKTYGKKEIFSYSHSQEVDPISSTLPKTNILFSVDNVDGAYNPNNLNGLSKYLIERQELKVRYGYKLDDKVEWIKGGTFYISDWDAPQNGLTASFNARDLLEFMTNIYHKGIYDPDGISLYDLADSVLRDADLPLNEDGTVKWVIDERLRDIYTVAPLPIDTHANCLQLIANAGECVIYQDREGILHIERLTSVETDYRINHFNSYSKSEIALTKPLKQVEVPSHSYTVASDTTELYKGAVTINGTQSLVVNYSNSATNIVTTVSGGTLNGVTNYANACELSITANGVVTITITGKVLEVSSVNIVTESGITGETISVSNPLITSQERAVSVGTWVEGYMRNRMVLKSSWRVDPRLDALDIVTNENDYNTNKVVMTSVKFDYNGAFKGSGEGRVT
jgi:hypothetical protein